MSTELAEGTVDGYTDTLSLTHHRRENDMFENSEEFSEEYQGLPDPEHLDTVMDGVLDTIAGNEGLTYAQHYLHSCLQTSGGISVRTGTEGFFSEIGNGLKSIWDYIMKMFKSVWNFFFGKGEKSSKSSSAKVKKKVEEAVEGLEDVKKTPANTEEGNKKITLVKAKVKKMVDSPKVSSSDKHTAEVIIKKLDEAKDKPPVEQQKVIKSSMDGLVKLEWEASRLSERQEHWDTIYKYWEGTVLKTIEGVDWKNSSIGKEYENFATSIRARFPDLRKSSIALFPKTLDGIDDAIKALEKMATDNKSWGTEGSIGHLTENYVKKIEHTISEMEHKLSQSENKELAEELKVTKAVLALANNLAQIAYQEADFAFGMATTLDLGFKSSKV